MSFAEHGLESKFFFLILNKVSAADRFVDPFCKMAAVYKKFIYEKVDHNLGYPPLHDWCNLSCINNVWINEYLALNLGQTGSYLLVMKEFISS